MNFRPAVLTLLVFACSIMSIVAQQCSVTLGTIIEDTSSGSIDIVIEGTSNNNLSNPDQGLCGVELYFEHTSIQDISITLESPAGQEITLVGPATGAGGNTQFTYWGIEFIPCNDPDGAMPDLPILDEVFTTEDNWGIFGNYTGQYFPQQGCLEDFNTGPVNGIWTVNFEDVQLFDVGSIDSIQLIFCDSTNVLCQECLADGGELTDIPTDYCEGDPDLNLDIEPLFDIEPSEEDYSYNYLIVQSGEVIQTNVEPDLTSFQFGSYQVCGISALETQTEDILDDVIGTDYGDLPDLFSDNYYCAALSTNCISINIIEVPDTILTTDTICLGDVLILDGEEYTETGEYVISFSEAFCDSVSILDLFVIDNQAEIAADDDTLTCLDGDIVLDASNSVTSPNTIMNWFRVGGGLDPAIANDISITITEPGTYGLSLITDICTDTAYIEIFNDESIPSFSFAVDTLTCYDPIVLIDMTPSIPLQSQQWTGAVTAGVEDISVAASGTYYIEGIALNGCVGRDSVVVAENLDVIDPTLLGDTITCVLDTALIVAVLPDDFAYNYTWSGPNIVGSTTDDSVLVTQDTTYLLTLQSLDNGCIEEFEYTVLIDTARADYMISSTVIDCNMLQSEVTITSPTENVAYYWEYEDGTPAGNGDTIYTTFGGEYQLFATTENGCIDSAFHTVVQDTILPEITVDDVTLTCLLDSVQLISVTTATDLTFEWTGPAMFESVDASPYVTSPGTYTLRATNSAGCTTIVVATVIAGEGLPNLTFMMSETLDCNIDTVTVTPSDTTNLRFEWLTDLIPDTTDYAIDVTQSGPYPLVITDTLSGCTAVYEVYVPGDYEIPVAEVSIPVIDCNNLTPTLSTSFLTDIDSLLWTNDQGLGTNEASPEISVAGEYYLTATGTNGCILLDTFTVTEELDIPIITETVPLLDCDNAEVDISFTTDDDTDDLYIRLPDGTLINESMLTVTSPADYMAIAISSTGCTDSTEMNVLQDVTAPVVTLITNGQINCTETTTTIIADTSEDGLAFDWSGVSIISPLGQDSIVVDSAGMYTVVVTDTANCMTTLDIEIQTFIDFPLVSSTASTINCTEDQATVDLEIPDDIILVEWTGPSDIDDDILSFDTDVPGTYTAYVTADNNCITENLVEVVVDTLLPAIDITTSGILDCDTDMVTLTGVSDAAGSTYDWTGPNDETYNSEIIEVAQSGIYTITITAPNTCARDTFIEVEADTLRPTIITGPPPIFSCGEGKVFLTIETDDNVVAYNWEGPFGTSEEPEPLAIAPGLYSVTVTNDLGCTTSAEIDVIDDTAGPNVMAADTFVTCDQLAVPLPLTIFTEDEVTFEWEGPSFTSQEQNPETNVLGEYIVYAVLERNQCVTVDTVNVTYQEVPPIFDAEYSDIDCYTPEVTIRALEADDDIVANWTDKDFNILAEDSLLVVAADTFNLVVIGQNTCEDTLQVVILEDFNYPEYTIDLDEPFQCENMDVTLTASIAYTINSTVNWTTVDGTINGDSAQSDVMISGEGTYNVSVINIDNGCETIDSITMVEEPQSLVDVTLVAQDPNCIGFSDGNIRVTDIEGGFAPYAYSMDGGDLQIDSLFDNLSAGNYSIEVFDSIGCTLEMDIDLLDGLDFEAIAKSDTLIIVGDTIDLLATFNVPDAEIATVTWTSSKDEYDCDDCFEAPVSPLFNTFYTLNATTIYGCQDTSEVLVRVNRNPIISVANVFAPGSENNGLFYIQQTSGIEKVLSMSVFDKWASRMFFAENVNPGDPSVAWDGTYKGRDVNPGVYVIVAELLLYSGEVVTYAGDITVLR